MYEDLKFILDYILLKTKETEIVVLHQQLAQHYQETLSAPSDEVTKNILDTQKSIMEAQEVMEPSG